MNNNPVRAGDGNLIERYRTLLEVAEAIAVHRDLDELFQDLAQRLPRVVHVNFVGMSLHDPGRNVMRLHTLQANVPAQIVGGHEFPVDDSPGGLVWLTQQPLLLSDLSKERRWPKITGFMREDGMKSVCFVPLTTAVRRIGAMGFASLQKEAYDKTDVEFLQQVAKQVAVAVENVLAYQEINELKDKLAKEKLYLEDEILTEYNFEEIIGESAALKRILKQAETVAPTDSTVLIQGETGTGKELIARAIHRLSGRRQRTFVKMNCAAIPSGLLESELFGHEKGAFTGAIAQKVGRFESAHQGTLFLDEVGDIPLELQSKLLRVLQEQEFERLGGTKTIKVNVRLVAATNHDLSRMVAEKQFRSDLYYRLNVFPVTVPSLRDRPEDIPLLVRYFAQQYARRMNKPIETIPVETMANLSRYYWPGNVRELENLVERSVILSQGPDLRVPLGELKAAAQTVIDDGTTLEAAERRHILQALKETNWVIGGPSGAAARLGMKRTTLQSKMQKLGIARHS
jgi:formate hydrogenlyase transcriptional activator